MTRPIVPPPVYLAAGLAAQKMLVCSPRGGVLRKLAAAALGAGAVGLTAAATDAFRRQQTTVHPLQPEKARSLVTGGANTLTRNPMYVGMAGLLAARAVRLGRWQALLPLAAFVAVVDRTQIPAEEEALREKFGPDYAEYAARVPRWVDRRSVDALKELVDSI